ncbi:MAG: TonB-dependent receptor plug domain-containing protein [bacterium]
MRLRLLILFFLLTTYIIPLRAQRVFPQDQDSTARTESALFFLDAVIVTASRSEQPLLEVPHAITVLLDTEIQRAKAGLSLEEILRETPGVVVNNRHNLSQGDRISIRGIGSRASFGVRGIKVMLDGIPLTMPDGQSQLNNLDLGAAGKIEVLRGPSSSLYGNASGGLIKIQSHLPANKPVFLQPHVILGEHGLRKWQARLSGGAERHGYVFNTGSLTFDGFREHAAAKINSLSGITRHNLNQHLRLNTVFCYVDAPYLFNPSSLSKEDARSRPEDARFFVLSQGASKRVEQVQAGATVTFEKKKSRLETTIYGVTRSLLNPIPGRIIELDRKAGGVRTVFNKRFGDNRVILLTVGGDLEIQHDERREFENRGVPSELVGALHNNDLHDVRRATGESRGLGVAAFCC